MAGRAAPSGLAFAGAVLCGGASRRMGRDKALLPIDGEPMAVRAAHALALAGAASVVAVGGDGPALTALGLPWLPDRWPGSGPLGGIVTALAHGGAEAPPDVVVVSCDLVQPSAELLAQLVQEHRRHRADVTVPVAGGREQWLHAVWRRSAAVSLEAAFGAGARSVHEGVAGLRVQRVAAGSGALADADAPHDLPPAARPPAPHHGS